MTDNSAFCQARADAEFANAAAATLDNVRERSTRAAMAWSAMAARAESTVRRREERQAPGQPAVDATPEI